MTAVEHRVLEKRGDHVVVQLTGEMSGQLWTEHLRHALHDHFVDDGVRLIRIDVSPISFMDSYGVATLVSLRRDSEERGKRFVVEGADGQVRDKLRVTGVLGFLQGDP